MSKRLSVYLMSFPETPELAEAAVDEDDVGVEAVVGALLAVGAADHFADGHEIVVTRGFDFEAAIFAFEGPAVHEADFGTHHLLTLEMGDIDGFQAADFVFHAQCAL